MTKTKLHETIMALCEEHNVSEKFKSAIDELTKPKAGGGSDVTDYTVFDAEDNPVYIFCAYHKKWEPVENDGELLFKANDKVKNGYDRSCIVGDKQWRDSTKEFNASKKAIVDDLLSEELTGSEASEMIAKLEEDRRNHSVREDGIGTEERPEL